MGNMQQSVEYSSGRSAVEFVSAGIPYDVFIALANSNLVDVQIGQIEFALTEYHLNGFRMIAGVTEKTADKTKTGLSSTADRLAPSIEETPLWHGEKPSGEFKRDCRGI